MRMDTRLVSGKSPEEVKELVAMYKNSTILRDLITKVLTDAIERATISLRDTGFLDKPNPLERFAANVALQRAYQEAIDLLQPDLSK